MISVQPKPSKPVSEMTSEEKQAWLQERIALAKKKREQQEREVIVHDYGPDPVVMSHVHVQYVFACFFVSRPPKPVRRAVRL